MCCCSAPEQTQARAIFAGLIASSAQEFFKFDGDLCLVMAHCEGGDLFAHAKALRWVLQASCSTACVEGCSIVECKVSPT